MVAGTVAGAQFPAGTIAAPLKPVQGNWPQAFTEQTSARTITTVRMASVLMQPVMLELGSA